MEGKNCFCFIILINVSPLNATMLMHKSIAKQSFLQCIFLNTVNNLNNSLIPFIHNQSQRYYKKSLILTFSANSESWLIANWGILSVGYYLTADWKRICGRNIHTNIQNCKVCKYNLMLFKISLLWSSLQLFDQKHTKKCIVVKYYYNWK